MSEERVEKVGPGAPFDEPLPSVSGAGRPSSAYRPPSFPDQLWRELEDSRKERDRLANENIMLATRLHRARIFGNSVASWCVKGFVVWAVFHCGLWSWSQTAPMSLGQQAYQYLDTAIQKGVLPSMAQINARSQTPTPPDQQTQPAPTPAK